MAGIRPLLYQPAEAKGDANTVKMGKVGRRVGRGAAGKVTGRAKPKLFK